MAGNTTSGRLSTHVPPWSRFGWCQSPAELKHCRLLDVSWSGYYGTLLLGPIEGATVSSHVFTDLHRPDKYGKSSGLLLPWPGYSLLDHSISQYISNRCWELHPYCPELGSCHSPSQWHSLERLQGFISKRQALQRVYYDGFRHPNSGYKPTL